MRRFKKILFQVVFFTVLFLVAGSLAPAYAQLFSNQPEKMQTRLGNLQFKVDSFADAEASYKKALDIKNNMPEAVFNLGDAEYMQKRYDDAAKQFQLSAQTNQDPTLKARAYHNLGNTLLEQKKWEDAIKAYKSALKINPKDADTRYNLAYANAKLQQQKKGGGGQNNKDQKDQKNKDKKDDKKQDQKQDQKDKKDKQDQKKQDQQSKDQQQKDQQQQQKPGQQSKLSKEQADKLLQALMDEEQKTAQKMQQKQVKTVHGKIKKDW